eukprot:3095869-Alexandrium_andersonii.AAC.1
MLATAQSSESRPQPHPQVRHALRGPISPSSPPACSRASTRSACCPNREMGSPCGIYMSSALAQ